LSLWILPFRIVDTLVVFRFLWVLHLISFTCPLDISFASHLRSPLSHKLEGMEEKLVEEELSMMHEALFCFQLSVHVMLGCCCMCLVPCFVKQIVSAIE
jgi:hypothetical protein